MYQSAWKPALLFGITLLVIDSKPAPSPEVICSKTSVTASKSLSTGSGNSSALSVTCLKLDGVVRKKLKKKMVFFYGKKPPENPRNPTPIWNGVP